MNDGNDDGGSGTGSGGGGGGRPMSKTIAVQVL